MIAAIGPWVPLMLLCAFVVAVTVGVFIAEAIATDRLRVDLLVALMRGGR